MVRFRTEIMRFRPKTSATGEQIKLLRANQIAGTTSDLKMDIIKHEIIVYYGSFRLCLARDSAKSI